MMDHEHFFKMQRHKHDQDIFHTLLREHEKIHREVTSLPNGIRTITTSEDPVIVSLLHDHVPAMHKRLQENIGLRFWDPAFVEIFAQREAIDMTVTLLTNGVQVEELSSDDNVVALIHAHGEAVSAFAREGFTASQRPSPLPVEYRFFKK